MPTTENDTLSRIQQDIMEISRREKELQEQYQHIYKKSSPASGHTNDNNNSYSGATSEEEEEYTSTPSCFTNGTTSSAPANGTAVIMNGAFTKPSKPAAKTNWTPLLRAISSSSLVPQQNGTAPSPATNQYQRRFTSGGGVRGVMEKFIKSRGKIAQLNALATTPTDSVTAQHQTFNQPDIETTRITVDPTKRKFVRNNFVPIEERMKREFQEMHSREKELHDHRKSVSSLNLLDIGKDDDDTESEQDHEMDTYPISNGMKSARSMGELFMASNGARDGYYDSEDELERHESNLGRNKHMAKSLAELCDAPEEELFTPGPQAVIMQFENMIRKNQQNRT